MPLDIRQGLNGRESLIVQGLLGCGEREITTSVSVPVLPAKAASKPVLQVCGGKRPFENLAAVRKAIFHPGCGLKCALAGFQKKKRKAPNNQSVVV